jgi:hypothetical protein
VIALLSATSPVSGMQFQMQKNYVGAIQNFMKMWLFKDEDDDQSDKDKKDEDEGPRL